MNQFDFDNIAVELSKARRYFSDFQTYHEGISVIREEFEELWEEIKKRNPDRKRMYKEAIQTIAMLMRFIQDFQLGPNEEEDQDYQQFTGRRKNVKD